MNDATTRLRDDFAMAALPQIIAASINTRASMQCEEIARTAYQIADAMMKARLAPLGIDFPKVQE